MVGPRAATNDHRALNEAEPLRERQLASGPVRSVVRSPRSQLGDRGVQGGERPETKLLHLPSRAPVALHLGDRAVARSIPDPSVLAKIEEAVREAVPAGGFAEQEQRELFGPGRRHDDELILGPGHGQPKG